MSVIRLHQQQEDDVISSSEVAYFQLKLKDVKDLETCSVGSWKCVFSATITTSVFTYENFFAWEGEQESTNEGSASSALTSTTLTQIFGEWASLPLVL